ncbi:ferredoxin domain-containing protein [Desulfurobacterium sp.]
MEFISKTVLSIAEMMCAAAITAPKGKGINLLHVEVFTGSKKDEVAELMATIGREKNIPFFIRDAKNVFDAVCVVFIGTAITPRRVPNCGFCGAKNCEDALSRGIHCAFATGDLGIAIGSAVSMASLHHIDNRIMFSFGKAAIEGGFVPEKIKVGYGIPLSVSGKNIFFDRK